MKKFIALLLALVMVFALAACGTKQPAGNTEPGTSTPAPSTAVPSSGAVTSSRTPPPSIWTVTAQP